MDPSKKELYTAKRSSGLRVDDPAIGVAVAELRTDGGAVNWMLMKINSSNALVLDSSGNGGLRELIMHLTDSDVYYGALRCMVEGKIKFFHIYVVGQNTTAMKKGKASLNKAAALSAVEAHGEIAWVDDLASFTPVLIRAAISQQLRCSVEAVDV